MFSNKLFHFFAICFIGYCVMKDFSKEKSLTTIPSNEIMKIHKQDDFFVNKANIIASDKSSIAQKAMINMLNNGYGNKFIRNLTVEDEGSSAKLPPALAKMQLQKEIAGEGNQAYCGSEVEINYRLSLGGENVIDNKNVKITLGAHNIPEYLEFLIEDMRENGMRRATMPGQYIKDSEFINAFSNKNNLLQNITLEVDLLKITKHDRPHLMVFDNKRSKGDMVLCGDSVLLSYQLYDMEGKAVLEKEEMRYFTVGGADTPSYINKLVNFKGIGSSGVVILPYNIWRNNKDKITQSLVDVKQGQALIMYATIFANNSTNNL